MSLRQRSSKLIRQQFIDYFITKHNHKFIKSSPVVPFCDPTVAFVNAGMNQVKILFNKKFCFFFILIFIILFTISLKTCFLIKHVNHVDAQLIHRNA